MISILITLLLIALVGFVVHLLVSYIPMPAPFQQVIVVACVVLIVLYLISALAGYSHFPDFRPLR